MPVLIQSADRTLAIDTPQALLGRRDRPRRRQRTSPDTAESVLDALGLGSPWETQPGTASGTPRSPRPRLADRARVGVSLVLNQRAMASRSSPGTSIPCSTAVALTSSVCRSEVDVEFEAQRGRRPFAGSCQCGAGAAGLEASHRCLAGGHSCS